MPEMDGFQTTKLIRNIGKNIPNIAVTANAMKGDREKSITAGKDDYLTKPLKSEELINTINKWVNNEPVENLVIEPEAFIESDVSTTDPIDMEHLKIFTDGDAEEEKELFKIFFEQAELSIADLENSCDKVGNDNWQSAAHKLKGSAANLGANNLAEICKQAEHNCSTTADEKLTMLGAIQKELEVMHKFTNKNSC